MALDRFTLPTSTLLTTFQNPLRIVGTGKLHRFSHAGFPHLCRNPDTQYTIGGSNRPIVRPISASRSFVSGLNLDLPRAPRTVLSLERTEDRLIGPARVSAASKMV